MKNKFLIHALGAMFGAMNAQPKSEFTISSNPEPHKPTAKNKPSRKTHFRYSAPSEHFGRRSEIVTATKPDGTQKRMKVKNALKHNYQFTLS